ncbi:DUF6903 family protein [Anaerobium acetethylicum]|uniref:Uncharacterized protein n=1 Tax=Anaerobium acetethylicum TaxID=1619234 RepID=A0A1D3TPR7_9FIRM|nr:hypothetical protein [Anaerobium acetethylicum]SCP95486.1 hypothetical protein SAMN05421730_1001602 [Anaerobium acetethylicum]
MEEKAAKLKTGLNALLLMFFVYLIIVGQKNIGPVKWLYGIFKTPDISQVGLAVMVAALAGILAQLYFYNRKYQ